MFIDRRLMRLRLLMAVPPALGATSVWAGSPSADEAASAASALASASASSTAFTAAFRPDDATSVPIGGLILLGILLVVALWAWWAKRTQHASSGSATLGLSRLITRQVGARDSQSGLIVESSAALGGSTRVHVVSWQGRKILVGTTPGHPPVTLDSLVTTPRPGHPE